MSRVQLALNVSDVDSPDEVAAAVTRLSAHGLTTQVEDATTCCYAVQDKVDDQQPATSR